MTEHAPLPWKVMEVFARGGSMGYFIVDSEGNNVTYHEPGEGNFFALIHNEDIARFIVTACNNYEQVLEVLKYIDDYEDIDINHVKATVRHAVRQAEEQTR